LQEGREDKIERQNKGNNQEIKRESKQSLPPPLVLKYHINTVSITSFLRNIFKALEEESKGN